MARLLALLVCALAQSHALVVSGHACALIRSGVNTPNQQLCRWKAPFPHPTPPPPLLKRSPPNVVLAPAEAQPTWANTTLQTASAACIAQRFTSLSSPPRRAQCAGCYGARGADCDGGAQEASEQDEDAPTQSQRAPARRGPTLALAVLRCLRPSSRRDSTGYLPAARSGLPRRGGRRNWRTTVRRA